MKQLGTSLTMYYTDNGGKLPSSYLVRHSKEWNQRDFETFASVYGDPKIKTGGLGATWVAVLWPYMKNKAIVWCPKDPTAEDKRSVHSRVSYYYKAAIDRAWYGDKDGKRQREGDFGAPADQVIFWERCSFHGKDGDQTLRNGDSINVVFFDGHTATKRILNCGYTASEDPPGPLPTSGKGEPAWFNAEIGNVPTSDFTKTKQFCDPVKYCDLLD